MTSYSTVRIAVVADVHAFQGESGDEAPSWVSLSEDQSNTRSNPFAGVIELADRLQLTADVIVCAGDLGDKASPEGAQYVWSETEKLRKKLGASLTLGAAGNHDLDSRFKLSKFDARGQVQALEPPFPVAHEARWMEYWAKNYTFVEHLGVRYLLLNSAAYHGYGTDLNAEYEKGRVSDRTLDRLRLELTASGERAANVLVTHHHPYRNDQIKSTDYSEMQNGDRLVNLLVDARVGPWLVIHGHKHLPRLFYAPGGNSAPTIFSAGSFAARLYPEYMDRARNEFYIIELQVPSEPGAVSSLKGRIHTWQWSFGNGWSPPKPGLGLGSTAAFGSRVDLLETATSLSQDLKASFPSQTVKWTLVLERHPTVANMIPDDLDHLISELKTRHALKFLREEPGSEIVEVQVP